MPDPQPLSLSPSLALSLTRILPSFLHQAPRWSPAALEHVSDAAVDEYFAPLGERELELPL